ncbi:MAG: FKBP-type peptidyl-prolyl cis-trans isomerase [Bifidobacteriaceae bacterium]|jgi:peptidylprolyl isomerase|nr:FKBP-type peptidyl-prolyl cis-trans isomerase [Bifidobacteriaceae bacterium]
MANEIEPEESNIEGLKQEEELNDSLETDIGLVENDASLAAVGEYEEDVVRETESERKAVAQEKVTSRDKGVHEHAKKGRSDKNMQSAHTSSKPAEGMSTKKLTTILVACVAVALIVGAGIMYLFMSGAFEPSGLQGIKYSQEGENPPTISVPKNMESAKDGDTIILQEGTGEEIVDGSVISLQAVIYDALAGEELQNTWTTNAAESMTYSEVAVYEPIYNALKGQKVGVAFAWVTEAEASEDAETGESTPATKHVGIGTIVALLPSRAEGTAKTLDSKLPQVTLADNGAPSIKIPSGFVPDKDSVTSEVTIEGTGEEVLSTDTVTVQYTGWLTDGTQFDSSWESGSAFSFSLDGGVIDGWTQGLMGKKVGSQVLLVVPPSYGYGEDAQGDIPGNSTLIFVVDILGRVPAAEAEDIESDELSEEDLAELEYEEADE